MCAPPSLPSLQHRHQAVGAFSLWRKPSLQIKWSELNSFTSTIYRPWELEETGQPPPNFPPHHDTVDSNIYSKIILRIR